MTKLYLESDIINVAIKKWGDLTKMEAKRDELDKIKQEEHLQKIAKMEQRRQDLADRLKVHGLQIRQDSTLCANYISGLTDESWTLDKVVTSCLMMNWLHTKTDYLTRLTNFLEDRRHIRNQLTYDDGYYSDDGCNVKMEIEKLRNKVIEEHGGGEPW